MAKISIGPGLLLLLYKILGKATGSQGSKPKHDTRPPSEMPIRGIMATAWFCDPDCSKRRKDDIQKLKKAGYNAIYSVGDLQFPPGDSAGRWHIRRGRTSVKVEDQVVRNIKWVSSQGMRPIVVMYNEPSVRSGGSHRLGAFDGATVSTSEMYTPARLDNEKKIWRQLLAECGDSIYAIFLALEPSHQTAIDFQMELARFLRQDLKFKGPVYGNGYDHATWSHPGTPYYVRSSGSINSLEQWMNSGETLKNLDGGDFLNASNSPTLVPMMIKKSGPDGWILYFNDYRDIGGPSTLQNWMTDPVKAGLA